ncbi:MAG: sigma-70 family RNA polymerase sigma factor [Pyrinomonadaceae bacterium]
MSQPTPNEITGLLVAWGEGDESALERLIPLVYDELRRLAHRYMRGERPGHTLQTTALVNEAYLRLVAWKDVQWENRAHFFAVSAQMMRRILVDFARDRQYLKRGAGAIQVSLGEAAAITECRTSDLVALDEALTSLFEVDRRKGQVVEMRFFGGLSVKEVAEVLKVSDETVMRDWRLSKVWLLRELGREAGSEG